MGREKKCSGMETLDKIRKDIFLCGPPSALACTWRSPRSPPAFWGASRKCPLQGGCSDGVDGAAQPLAPVMPRHGGTPGRSVLSQEVS